jgi:glycosyltransferase involved in cell wall biosynthesis
MKEPKISLVMPIYNSEKFLDESIESILNQTFQDFELVLVNDKSTDNSLRIIKEYMKKDKRIKLINNKENLGSVKSRNKGLKVAKGKYVAVLDSDDISLSKRFKIQHDYLEKNPHIFLVGSSAIYIGEKGKEIRRFRKYDNYKILGWRFFKSCGMIHSTVMFRNTPDVSYNEEFKSAHDYNFYLDILAQGKNITNIPLFLIKHRVHQGSAHTTNTKKQEFFRDKAIKEHMQFKPKLSLIKKIAYSFKLFLFYLKTFDEKKITKN